jgi:hypothetical protein
VIALWDSTSNVARAADARTVVVFYANETSARAFSSEHYQTLLQILASAHGEFAKGLRAELAADALDFPASVVSNEAALMTHARRVPFDLVVFTNEMALDHRYLRYRGAEDRQETLAFAPLSGPEHTHPFMVTAPLSDSRMLKAALAEVVTHYEAQRLEIVLLAYSHGTLDMALMPRVNIDLRLATENEIRDALERGPRGTAAPGWARLQGTSKTEFWRVLSDVSTAQPHVRFPLVIRAGCQSVLMSWEEYFAIPRSVGLIGHTALESPTLKSTRFDKVFERASGAMAVTDLATGAREAGFLVDSRSSLSVWLIPVTLWQIPLWCYFAPFGVWVLWYGPAAARKRWVARLRGGTERGART